MKGIVGRICGDTSATEFNFVVLSPKEVKRTDFVKVWNDIDGWVIAQILDIKAKADFNENDALNGKTAKNEIYIAKAIVIGCRDKNGLLKVPKTPFVPGENVFKADDELVMDALGLKRDGVYIGLLEERNIKVKLALNPLVQKHCCILAKTGSGKSYAAGVIIEELLERDVPLLIIDPHGEYTSMKYENDSKDEIKKMGEFGVKPKGYKKKIKIYTPPNSPFLDRADDVIKLDGLNLTPEEIIELTGLANTTSQALVYQAIKNLKGKEYSIEDIIEEVESIKHNAKWSLLGHLEKILDSGLFDTNPTPINRLLQKGKASIIDMRGIPPEHQDLIVSRICNQLFELRKVNKVPPGMIVIEEAHNFIPERGYGKAISTPILRNIASEGRKFGLGLMVISQRPARIDKNVISQCNTQIILKVTNPNDVNAIRKGIEGLTADMVDEVKRLPPGTAIVVSPELERPIIVRIRIRKSKHGGASIDIVKEQKIKSEKRMEKVEKKKKDGLLKRLFGG